MTWHAGALCANRTDLDPVFFPERGGNARVNKEAKEFCGNCPVRLGCLTAALDEEKGLPALARFGVRGGMTSAERARLEFGQPEPAPRVRPAPAPTCRPQPNHLPECVGCGVGLRTRTQPDDGRRIHVAFDRCGRCYDRYTAARLGREIKPLGVRPEKCVECGVKVRPQRSNDLPGAPYAGRGMCRRCYQRANKKVGAA